MCFDEEDLRDWAKKQKEKEKMGAEKLEAPKINLKRMLTREEIKK